MRIGGKAINNDLSEGGGMSNPEDKKVTEGFLKYVYNLWLMIPFWLATALENVIYECSFDQFCVKNNQL